MTECIVASAPGKVVLSGEYAVLDGAPAICMAVDRRARVRIEATGDDFHEVIAPGHVDEPRRFLVRDGIFGWLDSSDEFELLEHVWRTSGVDRQGGLALELDTSAFLDPVRGCKTGIGSSAALAVALAFALHELDPVGAVPMEVAHQAHLDFQGGLGSGVDIATSGAGGLVDYRMKKRTVSRLAMPDGLECRLFWSGSPASTGKKLARYSAGGSKPSRAALDYAARRMAQAWASGSARAVLDEYREYVEVLRVFNADHDLGIFAAGHEELTALADAAGLIYKPCGAGGGDIGILLADNAESADAFIASKLPAAFKKLDLQCDEHGVEVTRADD
jgi:phosphomevalonate kinase